MGTRLKKPGKNNVINNVSAITITEFSGVYYTVGVLHMLGNASNNNGHRNSRCLAQHDFVVSATRIRCTSCIEFICLFVEKLLITL